MCEMAIMNPDKTDRSQIAAVAQKLYRSQRSSLGIVAVYNDGEEYEYQVYKSLRLNKDELYSFIDDRMDCYRFFIHGRLATHGDVTVENAHPLKITDDGTDVQYLLHNGVVMDHHSKRKQHEARGCEYNTDVDSEAIAHEYGEVPESLDRAVDENEFVRQAGFVLFGSDRILVFTNGKYRLTKSCEMAARHRNFGPSTDADTYNYLMVRNNA